MEGAVKDLLSCCDSWWVPKHGRTQCHGLWGRSISAKSSWEPATEALFLGSSWGCPGSRCLGPPGILPGTVPHRGRMRTFTSVSLCWQAFEDKQRLWLDELEDLKQMYMARLQQVTQQAQRGQRALQLQLYKAQQEKKRLQEELSMQQCQCEETKLRQSQGERVSPKLEETKWEVSPLLSLSVATLQAVQPGWGSGSLL